MSISLVSCKSEYEERLQEARELQEQYLLVEETNMMSPREELIEEMHSIEREIEYLARVSGNESLFYKELENQQ